MSALGATLRLDVRLQARSKLYAIGLGVALVFGLVGRLAIDGADAGRVLVGFYLLGLGGTTYIFGAALVLMEKSQGTLAALRTSPLRSSTYLQSKIISLTGFALLESLVVYAVGFWGAAIHLFPLIVGILLLGTCYALIGMGQVAGHDSVTAFLMPGALLVGTVVQLPVLHLLEVAPSWAWYLVPTQAPMLLMLAAFEPLAPWQWIYVMGMTIAALGVGWWWARRQFARHIALPER